MSQNDDVNWTHFNVRCQKDIRKNAEKLAKMNKWSLSEWVRQAMEEKIDRDLGAHNMAVPEPIKPVVIKPASPIVSMSLDELERFIDARMRAHDAAKKGPFGIRKGHHIGSLPRQQNKLNDAAKRRALAVMKRSGTD